MGSSIGCCADDPTEKVTNMDTAHTTEGRSHSDEQDEIIDSKPTTKQTIPEDSFLSPTNKDGIEESLLVPSTLSAVEDDHDPLPPSDYEDNADEYVLKQDENKDIPVMNNRPDDDTASNDADIDDDNDDSGANANDNDTGANVEENHVREPGMEREDDTDKDDDAKLDKGEDTSDVVVPQHRQLVILQDVGLRQRSVDLVTGDNGEFIKFLKKILKSKLNEKIWAKCDPENTERIETEKFMYFWTLPVTLFKVAIYQRQHGNKEKPKVDQKELKKDFQHLATWIIRKYGEEQDDGGCTFVLSKSNFTKEIVDYVKTYADVKGELYEEY